MKKGVQALCLLGIFVFIVRAWAYSTGPPAGRTGAEGERTCNDFGCHSSFALNSGSGKLSIEVPPHYLPGQTYRIRVTLQQTGQRRWGFQATVKKEGKKERGGEIRIVDPQKTQFAVGGPSSASAPQYIEQTEEGTFEGTVNGPVSWEFDWVAPSVGTGNVVFYVAGNAANGNGSSSGDYIYTTRVVVPEASPIVPGDVNGDGQLTLSDAVLALRMAVGLITPTSQQIEAGDVAPKPGTGPKAGAPYGDGRITIADVVRLLRKVVGLEKEWP
jgi:hypothetical protein